MHIVYHVSRGSGICDSLCTGAVRDTRRWHREAGISGVLEIAGRARRAAFALATTATAVKDAALAAMAAALDARADEILEGNGVDLERARAEGTPAALIDRLTLTPARIAEMANGLRHVVTLPDPVGETLASWTVPSGLAIEKVRVPLGVVGIIYEARPNVTVDAAGLCLKSGNACVLRGSRSAISSNAVLADILDEAGTLAGLPPDSVQLIRSTDRESVKELMRAHGLVDVLIPRGGADLIRTVVEESTVPVIETGVGNCHVYVDSAADLGKATAILVNSKTQRPSVCNAAETLLVHRALADRFLPGAIEELTRRGVELRGDEAARSYSAAMKPATEDDWYAEYLDLIMAVKVVGSVEEAVEHVNRYGSRHTEAIVTEDEAAARLFAAGVDSACVMVNASTRFADGGEFGFGAEIGISNQKLHARGPMALPELTSYKYIVHGTGQVRG
ncbi:MAG: glutamate-5-semialdehyde dehydrogenase [Acidobacteria bacterium]|nr:glutamate-5-semialdehyde dehydrogenase [Acidobacteriota bacterium]